MVLTLYVVGAILTWIVFAAYSLHEGWLGRDRGDIVLFVIVTGTVAVVWLFVAVGLALTFATALLFRLIGPKPVPVGAHDE